MASSFYSNSQHIDFDSVLAMDDQCMVSMFNLSGLAGFLRCPAVIYEAALVEFFENASVREGVIISTMAGQLVEISEEWFAESFDLLVDGLGDLSEIPKDVIFDARSIVSLSGEPVSLSGKKNQMKIEFLLLCDIMAKSISVKAGSFNAITVEKFSMVTTVFCGVRMNWASILFNILKKMVSPGSKQAKGFAVQISLLLENIPNLELGESSEFPASKILTEKTVHRFVSLNDKVGAEEAAGAPKPKAASKKRQVVAAVGAPVIKKKRTVRKKSSSSKDNLEIVVVVQEAVPIQMVEPITVAPAAEELSDQPAGKTDDEEAVAAEVDASADRDQTAVEVGGAAADKDFSLVDDPDTVINQVLNKLDSISDDKDDEQSDRAETWFDRAFDEMLRNDSPVVTPSDTDEEEETVDVVTAGRDQQVQFSEEQPVVMEMNDELLDADEQMSLENILITIPVDVSLPSAGMEITKIKMGKEIKIPEVNERTWFLNSLPKIPADNKGKAILVEKETLKGNPAKEHYFLICADIDLLVNLRAQVIEAVDQFFHSFSFKKLATINIEELSRNEEQVLIWGETEITHVALSRKSLFSWLPTVDITDFLSSIALERTALRQIQRSFASSVAPHVQLFDEQSSSSSSSDESMNFDDFTSTSLPAAPIPDVTIALNQLRASIVQLRERDDGGAKNKDTLLLHLHNFEKQVITCLDAQDRVLGALRRDSNDQRNLLSLELQSSNKQLGTQILTTGIDVVDVRRVVRESHQELNARINSLDENVAATRQDLLEFSAQAQQTLNIITSQLSELVAYINRGGDNKKGESSSSRRPLPTPVHQSEGTGDAENNGAYTGRY
ncbi:hypothetical protein F511_22081 [Dorcoceras hygrometricum]|uniref:Dystroglycan-like n=1 Tax=Dorcoceras hygrometricum TaxID=472368 RepID=A0A2Z7C094_9LAMI|nr:hypothetical protein F511_22081 [Dorcoceras hygrometricum]